MEQTKENEHQLTVIRCKEGKEKLPLDLLGRDPFVAQVFEVAETFSSLKKPHATPSTPHGVQVRPMCWTSWNRL